MQVTIESEKQEKHRVILNGRPLIELQIHPGFYELTWPGAIPLSDMEARALRQLPIHISLGAPQIDPERNTRGLIIFTTIITVGGAHVELHIERPDQRFALRRFLERSPEQVSFISFGVGCPRLSEFSPYFAYVLSQNLRSPGSPRLQLALSRSTPVNGNLIEWILNNHQESFNLAHPFDVYAIAPPIRRLAYQPESHQLPIL